MLALTATAVAATAPATAEYRLAVRGTPGEAIRLHTARLPSGWMVSFCTGTLCQPYAFVDRLPRSGVKLVDVRVFPLRHQATRAPAFAIDAGDKRMLIIGR